MLISELARRSGVSARALRHYEQQGLLVPNRDSNGYRVYRTADLATVERIRIMIDAGMATTVIARYLDCLRTGEDGFTVQMCDGLRGELAAVQARLDATAERIDKTRNALDALADRAQPI